MLRFNDPIAIRAIQQATSVGFKPSRDQCVARFDKTGKLLGGVFFTDFNIVSVQVHIAGFVDDWIDRSILWVAVDWPYNKLGVNKMLAPVRASNWKCIAFCSHFGFNIEARIRDVFPDGDLLVLSLYKSDCKFLNMRPPQLTIDSEKVEGTHGEIYTVS